MRKDFDHLLARHGLFDETVESAQIVLLGDEVPSRQRGHFTGTEQHHAYHTDGDAGQRRAQDQHHRQDTDNRDQAVEQLGHTLADHLAQSINIICIDRHNVAVRMRIKIFDRQTFHVLKQLCAQASHRPLGDACHGAGLQISASDSHSIKAGDAAHSPQQR